MDTIESSKPIIAGVTVQPLKQIKDKRGMVMHMMRNDSPWFKRFGEIYFSVVYQKVIKAWKYHNLMIQNFTVPVGEILLVIYDSRQDSTTKNVVQEIKMGVNKYGLVSIPPMVWYGFKGVSDGESMIVNCASIPHDPNESKKIDINDPTIPYKWKDC